MNRFIRRVFIPCFTLILLLSLLAGVNAQVSPGGTYYVATNGVDTNPGTEAQPFLTLAKGVSVLKPGDTLLVKEGLYREELRNSIPSGVSWDRPVTLRAYPGHRVVIEPNQGAERVITFSRDKHYVVIDGFILDGTNVRYEVIKIAGVMDTTIPSPSHIRITNNEIRNAGAATNSNGEYRYFSAGILTTGMANYVEYINNRIYNNGVTDFDHGIYHTASYGLIEGNIIYGNMGSGVKIGWGQNTLDNIVRNNIIYDNNAAQGADGQKKQGRGIGVYAGSGTLVYNNVIWGAHAMGIDVTYNGNNAKIFNNTVMSTSGYGIVVGIGSSSAATATNTLVKNNIVYQQGTLQAIFDSRGINTVIENNMTFGRNPDIDADRLTNTVFKNNLENVNPAFIDANARNFALQASSPAIDKGVVIGEVLFDFANIQRPQGTGYDIGAFEFQGQPNPTQPVPATPAPATPAPEVPVPATPVPETPVPTPVTYTNPTVYLDIQSSTVQPGDTLSVNVNVANSVNLFGLQMRCTTNPNALVGVTGSDGTIFTSSNSLFANQAYNPLDGTWIVAASRMRPETGFNGDGVALTMNYRLQEMISSPITCTVTALDSNGTELIFDVVNTTFTPAEGSGVTTPDTPPVLDDQPLPTDVPEIEPTVAPEDGIPTTSPPTVIPAENTVIVSGTAAYQIRLGNLGIAVQLLANGEMVDETITDSEGNYSFNSIAPGDYVVKASASGHLAVARSIIIDTASNQPLLLERLTLVAGDIDDSTVIDLGDAGLIGANFGLEGALFPTADLNTDNIINISDLVVIGANFGLSGVITIP